MMIKLSRNIVAVLLWTVCATGAQAAGQVTENVTITMVAVNGGADTSNPGLTCIRLSSSVSAACTSGWIAVPNNNRSLLATALLAKQSNATVMVTYEDATPNQHCPWIVITGCSVQSILIK